MQKRKTGRGAADVLVLRRGEYGFTQRRPTRQERERSLSFGTTLSPYFKRAKSATSRELPRWEEGTPFAHIRLLSIIDIYCYTLYLGLMNVHLGAAFDEFVAGLLKGGYYQTQSEVLREGLRLLKEREEIKRLRLAELRKEIALGGEQADRGQFVDGPAVFAKIRKRSAQRKKRSKA